MFNACLHHYLTKIKNIRSFVRKYGRVAAIKDYYFNILAISIFLKNNRP